MNISLEKISSAYKALLSIEEKMPRKQSFIIFENMELLKSSAEWCEKQRFELIKKYGEEKNGMFSVKPESMTNFIKEMNDVYVIEKDLDIKTIPLEEINFEISPPVLSVLINSGIIVVENRIKPEEKEESDK